MQGGDESWSDDWSWDGGLKGRLIADEWLLAGDSALLKLNADGDLFYSYRHDFALKRLERPRHHTSFHSDLACFLSLFGTFLPAK